MAKISQTSIYIKMCRLRHWLKKMQFMMSKADRIIYGTPLLEECAEVLRDFVLAYEYRDERDKYIRKMIADFAVLRIDLEGINHESILKEPKQKERQETAVELPSCTDKMYMRVFEIVGNIDEDITRWKQSLRSKSAPDQIREQR